MPSSNLSPDKARIVGDSLLVQHGQELRLEIPFAMMFSLLDDVCGGCFNLGASNGECAVALLPGEVRQGAVLVHPMGRRTLDLAHGRCYRHRGRQREQEMRMVVHATNFEGLYLESACDPSHVSPKSPLDLRRDDLAPFLGGENAMIERGTIGVRHTPPCYSRFSPQAPELPSFRPDGADGFNGNAAPGFHPGLLSFLPYGKEKRYNYPAMA